MCVHGCLRPNRKAQMYHPKMIKVHHECLQINNRYIDYECLVAGGFFASKHILPFSVSVKIETLKVADHYACSLHV